MLGGGVTPWAAAAPLAHLDALGSVGTNASSEGAAVLQVASAMSSLESGRGPAEGQLMHCTAGTGGVSGSCGRSVASAIPSVDPDAVPAPSPIASWGASIVYDAADGYVLVYGGSAGDHTWTYLNGVWKLLPVSPYPSIRTEESMTYDAADDEVLLFGGEYHLPKGANSSVSNVSYYSDTWAFHGGRWYNITEPQDSPTGREKAMMTYDGADGYVVLFGGSNATSYLDDTWTFKGGTWTNVTGQLVASSTPSCRVAAGFAYDAAAGYVVMFGGSIKIGSSCLLGAGNETSNQTWTFSHGSWSELIPSAVPPGRGYANLVYDAPLGGLLLFGGISRSDTALSDTWEFSHGAWSQIVTDLYPTARFSASMVFDTAAGNVLLFGGLSEPQRDAPILNDTWVFAGSRWVNLTPIGSPPALSGLSFAYDTKDGFVLLFGGESTAGVYENETWKFLGGVWMELTPPISPPARADASLAFDTVAGYVVLFGGTNGTTDFNDTWAFVRGVWTPLVTDLEAAPSARAGASLAYDANASELILFGGVGPTGYLGDTWTFTNTTFPYANWTQVVVPVSPSPRAESAMAYYPPQQLVVLFGGENSTAILGDTWVYSPGNWTKLAPFPAPSARFGASFTYDTIDGLALLFGGSGPAGPLNDSWMFLNGIWTNITPWSPPARSSAGLAYDTPDSVVVLFGGSGTGGALGDTWRFTGGNWSQLLPTATPTPPAPPTPGVASSHTLEYLGIAVIVGLAAVALVWLAIRRNRGSVPPREGPKPWTPSDPRAAAPDPAGASSPEPRPGAASAGSPPLEPASAIDD